ncbi:hypothetical protein D9M69_556370 [compost metagenome]
MQADGFEVTLCGLAPQAHVHPCLVGRGDAELRGGQGRDPPVRIGGHGTGVAVDEMRGVIEQFLSVDGKERLEQHQMVDPFSQA